MMGFWGAAFCGNFGVVLMEFCGDLLVIFRWSKMGFWWRLGWDFGSWFGAGFWDWNRGLNGVDLCCVLGLFLVSLGLILIAACLGFGGILGAFFGGCCGGFAVIFGGDFRLVFVLFLGGFSWKFCGLIWGYWAAFLGFTSRFHSWFWVVVWGC